MGLLNLMNSSATVRPFSLRNFNNDMKRLKISICALDTFVKNGIDKEAR